MSRFRVLGSMLLALSLAIGVSGAAAGNGGADLVIGHGIPNAAVDVCASTAGTTIELKSDFQYGKTFQVKDLPAGRYWVVVRAASGVCKGAIIINLGVIKLDGTEDLSIIATKKRGVPTVAIFDNSAGYLGDPDDAVLSIKHAAMLGAADVYVSVLFNSKLASTEPTAAGVPKLANANFLFTDSDVKVGVSKAGEDKILKETPYWAVKDGKINHVVAIGPPDKFRFLRYRTDNKGD